MFRRLLPQINIEASALGFGCSSLMGCGSRAERQALLGQALDCGITHFDVARYYGLGYAEEELGLFLKENPGKATVTTKFGINPLPLVTAATSRILDKVKARSLASFVRSTAGKQTHLFNLSEAKNSLNTSLRKLKIEAIDLYLLHDCISHDVESQKLLDFLFDAKTAGKIRAFGLATNIDSILEIERTRPAYSKVVQFENSVITPNLDQLPNAGHRAVVTHRALSANFHKLRQKLLLYDPKIEIWNSELGIDLKDPKRLADAMLAYALISNSKGIVLFSARSKERIKDNAKVAQSPILEENRLKYFAQLMRSLP
jgi:D-threo-aldose 1-dehydrogenase